MFSELTFFFEVILIVLPVWVFNWETVINCRLRISYAGDQSRSWYRRAGGLAMCDLLKTFFGNELQGGILLFLLLLLLAVLSLLPPSYVQCRK